MEIEGEREPKVVFVKKRTFHMDRMSALCWELLANTL